MSIGNVFREQKRRHFCSTFPADVAGGFENVKISSRYGKENKPTGVLH
jgi:hypothetical protein